VSNRCFVLERSNAAQLPSAALTLSPDVPCCHASRHDVALNCQGGADACCLAGRIGIGITRYEESASWLPEIPRPATSRLSTSRGIRHLSGMS
jgi:hypothetical protein